MAIGGLLDTPKLTLGPTRQGFGLMPPSMSRPIDEMIGLRKKYADAMTRNAQADADLALLEAQRSQAQAQGAFDASQLLSDEYNRIQPPTPIVAPPMPTRQDVGGPPKRGATQTDPRAMLGVALASAIAGAGAGANPMAQYLQGAKAETDRLHGEAQDEWQYKVQQAAQRYADALKARDETIRLDGLNREQTDRWNDLQIKRAGVNATTKQTGSLKDWWNSNASKVGAAERARALGKSDAATAKDALDYQERMDALQANADLRTTYARLADELQMNRTIKGIEAKGAEDRKTAAVKFDNARIMNAIRYSQQRDLKGMTISAQDARQARSLGQRQAEFQIKQGLGDKAKGIPLGLITKMARDAGAADFAEADVLKSQAKALQQLKNQPDSVLRDFGINGKEDLDARIGVVIGGMRQKIQDGSRKTADVAMRLVKGNQAMMQRSAPVRTGPKTIQGMYNGKAVKITEVP